jgi:hypothetical protein
MGTGGQRHVPAALPPGKTRYPLYRRLGGLQDRSGLVRKIPPLPPRIRSPDRPVLSQLLYRLRYPVPHVGRIPRNNSFTLQMEAECSSEIPMLPITTSKCRRHLNKSGSSLRYALFSSYLVPFVCPRSTALVLLLSEKLLQRQYNDRVRVRVQVQLCGRDMRSASEGGQCKTSHARHMHPNMCHRTRNKSQCDVTSMNTARACP